MPEREVRTRFAPSPTGYLHIGGARTALYNWLHARHYGGKFILRIEDTDRARSTEESTRAILDSLTWLGLDWDEGPHHQSDRLARYREVADRLVEQGVACREHDPERGTAIRFRMPRGKTVVRDSVHGPVTIDNATIEDFIILKSDGFPAYNFACVVDDSDMAVTCVIRGDEHMSNTPKQIAMYEALSLEPPRFAHIPMILGPDGGKLSKRHGATSVLEYRKLGYLPGALTNFIALLGWSPGGNREMMSVDEMILAFTIDRCSKVSSRFDTEKLTWMNGRYMKELPHDELVRLARGYVEAAGFSESSLTPEAFSKLVELYRERARTLVELPAKASYALVDRVEYDLKAVKKFICKSGAVEVLKECRKVLGLLESFDVVHLEGALRTVADKLGVGFGKVAQPLRVAVTGGKDSPGIFETLELVGKDRTLSRIGAALEAAGNLASGEGAGD